MNFLDELRQDVNAAKELAIGCLPLPKVTISFSLGAGEDATTKMAHLMARLNKDVQRCVAYTQEASQRVQEAWTLGEAQVALQFARLAEGIERRYAHMSTNVPPIYPNPDSLVLTPFVMLCFEFEAAMQKQAVN